MHRRAFILSTAAALTLGSSAAISPARADAMDEIKSRGKILVAIDPTFPPFEFTDANNNIIGHDADLITAIAKDWGVAVEWQVMAFPGIIPGLIAGSFDMSASALNVTAERAQRIDYTVPIAATVNVVVKRSGNDKVKSSKIEDLSGLTCAVKQTTQPEQMMQKLNEYLRSSGKAEVGLMSFDTVEQTIAALAAERVECVVDDKAVLTEAMKSRTDTPLEIVGEIGDRALIAWGVSKSNPKLTAALSETIIKLKQNGELEKLQMKYFGFPIKDLPETDFIPTEN
ncbi:MAG: transporter substrate-binding domain-containing protein [Parvibaculaceae bacterium]